MSQVQTLWSMVVWPLWIHCQCHYERLCHKIHTIVPAVSRCIHFLISCMHYKNCHTNKRTNTLPISAVTYCTCWTTICCTCPLLINICKASYSYIFISMCTTKESVSSWLWQWCLWSTQDDMMAQGRDEKLKIDQTYTSLLASRLCYSHVSLTLLDTADSPYKSTAWTF